MHLIQLFINKIFQVILIQFGYGRITNTNPLIPTSLNQALSSYLTLKTEKLSVHKFSGWGTNYPDGSDPILCYNGFYDP